MEILISGLTVGLLVYRPESIPWKRQLTVFRAEGMHSEDKLRNLRSKTMYWVRISGRGSNLMQWVLEALMLLSIAEMSFLSQPAPCTALGNLYLIRTMW
jgi:hypothetical protein